MLFFLFAPPGATALPPMGGVLTVAHFGAQGNGTTDDTAAIQAAIDYAYAHKIQSIHMPSGNYKTSGPIYLDPPGNLRGDINNPTIFNFSLALIGDGGIGNQEGFGTRISPTAGNFVVLWVGPGQGMHVKGIQIMGPNGIARAAMPSSGCGIALSGGSAGSSRTLIEHCGVFNLSNGIAYGFNIDQLCDSNSLTKVFVDNCYRGVSFLKSQTYINDLTSCNITHCNTAIYNPLSKMVSVSGGNYSSGNSAVSKKATIGSVSALSTFSETIAGNTFTNYRFTAVVSSPDGNWINGTSRYNRATLNLPGFGLVPLRIENYMSGTVTLSIWPYWRFFHFGLGLNLISSTDLQAEIQAATTLYCCELMTIFCGGNFHVRDAHVENFAGSTGVLTCLLDASAGTNLLEGIFFNYDPSHSQLSPATGDSSAVFYCQQSHPFLRYANCTVRIKDCEWNQTTTPLEGIVFDVGANARLVVQGDPPFSPIIRYCDGNKNITGYNGSAAETKLRGHGEFEFSPFLSYKATEYGAWTNGWLRKLALDQAPMRGFRPDPHHHPRITPTQYATLSGTLPTIGTYPALNGETFYANLDYNTGVTTHAFARSAHQFYSYGQNLTTTTSYKGQTTKVAMDNNGIKWMFPGLKIILNNGTDGDQSYLVVGVHYALSYVDVLKIDENNTTLVGTKTTTFSGITTVKQEAYSLSQYP